MALQKLSPQACLEQMQSLPLWQLDAMGGSITREFVFKDFVQAFDFMTQIAHLAEQHQHHPNWLNVYHKVSVTWTTHDLMGLSDNDILMARMCDHAFNQVK
jgi:4a-hydroxytetrahydrobiopterin dehydratase